MHCLQRIRIGLALISAAALCCAGAAHGQEMDPDSLASMSLEDLMNITVTSVSKREERVGSAAAAIHVITAEDIRRSAANTLPELLRGVPGVSVARQDASKWAISIRGFNDRFSNKLLVLIDGRAVYTPLFSGVYWEYQDIILEDIERIEIIRGPGATHWGSNAVNGVINITTKNAKDTSNLFSVGGGTEEQFFSTLRLGGEINADTHYRLSLRYAARDDGATPAAPSAGDQWNSSRAAFRLDYTPEPGASLMLSSEIYRTGRGETDALITAIPFVSVRQHSRQEDFGGHLLLDWRKPQGVAGEFQIAGYYSREDSPGTTFSHVSDTINVELRHSLNPLGRHRLMWGLGIRYRNTDLTPSPWIYTTERSRSGLLYSAFLTDEISFLDDRLRVHAGARFEYIDAGRPNPFNAFEVQPSLRVAWTPDETRTLWAAVSRAIRIPSEVELDEEGSLLAYALPFIDVGFKGSNNFESEELVAYELGYRSMPSARLSLDATVFYHNYDKLRTLGLVMPRFRLKPLYPNLFIPFEARNAGKGRAWGAELAADVQITANWRMQATYSYLNLETKDTGGGISISTGEAAGTSPEHQAGLRSHVDLPRGFEFDAYLQYVDTLEGIGIENYWNLNLRLGWRFNDNLNAEIVGQNLLRPSRPEFKGSFVSTQTSEVERGVYGKLTWEF